MSTQKKPKLGNDMEEVKDQSVDLKARRSQSPKLEQHLKKLRIIRDVFDAITTAILSYPSILKTFYEYEKLSQIMKYFLIDTQKSFESEDALQGFYNLCNRIQSI